MKNLQEKMQYKRRFYCFLNKVCTLFDNNFIFEKQYPDKYKIQR